MEVAPLIPILRNTVNHDVLLIKNTGAGLVHFTIYHRSHEMIEELGGISSFHQPTNEKAHPIESITVSSLDLHLSYFKSHDVRVATCFPKCSAFIFAMFSWSGGPSDSTSAHVHATSRTLGIIDSLTETVLIEPPISAEIVSTASTGKFLMRTVALVCTFIVHILSV